MGSDASAGTESSRSWPIVHHLFVAIIVLVMDYCYNREEPQAAERKAEIMVCFRSLEKSQKESTIAKNGVEQLRKVFADWRVKRDRGLEDSVADGNQNLNPDTTITSQDPLQASDALESSTSQTVDVSVQMPGQSLEGTWNTAAHDGAHLDWLTANNDSWLESINVDSDTSSPEWGLLLQNLDFQQSSFIG